LITAAPAAGEPANIKKFNRKPYFTLFGTVKHRHYLTSKREDSFAGKVSVKYRSDFQKMIIFITEQKYLSVVD